MNIEELTIVVAKNLSVAMILEKIFGPSLEMYGEQVKTLQVKAGQNLYKFLIRTIEKIRETEKNKEFISPRITAEFLHDLYFYHNDVMVEYYSGILAASKTQDPYDDNLIPLLPLIKRMSTINFVPIISYTQSFTHFLKEKSSI